MTLRITRDVAYVMRQRFFIENVWLEPGCVLLNPKGFEYVEDPLSPAEFRIHSHERIFRLPNIDACRSFMRSVWGPYLVSDLPMLWMATGPLGYPTEAGVHVRNPLGNFTSIIDLHTLNKTDLLRVLGGHELVFLYPGRTATIGHMLDLSMSIEDDGVDE